MSFSSSRIESKAERSALVRGALSVARRAHGGQFRQTGCDEIPFIDHPLAVAELLAEQGYPEEVLAAALLHDVGEHAEMEPDSLRARFGDEVVGLVEAMTEDPAIADYEERKKEHRERVAEAGPEARAIFAADKAANVAVLREAYKMIGEDVDEDLPVSLDVKILVWEFDLEMLFAHSPEVAVVDRFAEEMVGLWGQRAEDERASLC
ncbi:MAG TPA: HD domain-containing protein [Solirubrobacterales bacterium]|nr:HD domain-containing protein [Solirubrobacterales bacterium]